MKQTQEAPTTDKDGEYCFWLREIASDDVSETDKVEPDEGHDEEPEHEDSHCGVRAPRGTLAESYEDNAGGQNLHNVAERRATDQSDKNQAENHSHETGREASIDG